MKLAFHVGKLKIVSKYLGPNAMKDWVGRALSTTDSAMQIYTGFFVRRNSEVKKAAKSVTNFNYA